MTSTEQLGKIKAELKEYKLSEVQIEIIILMVEIYGSHKSLESRIETTNKFISNLSKED